MIIILYCQIKEKDTSLTVWALERPLLRVRPHVDLQPAGTTEHLTGDDANLRMTSRELP